MTPKWGRHHLDQEVEVRGWCPVGMAERRDTLLNVCIQVVTAGKWTHAFGNSWRYFGHVWSCLDTLYTYSTHQQNGKVSEMITAALYFVCSFIEYSTVVTVPCTKSIYMHCTYKGENVRILQQIQKVSQMIIAVARCASRGGHGNASKLRIVLHCLLVWHHPEAQACLHSLPPLNSLLTVFLNYQTDIVLTMRLTLFLCCAAMSCSLQGEVLASISTWLWALNAQVIMFHVVMSNLMSPFASYSHCVAYTMHEGRVIAWAAHVITIRGEVPKLTSCFCSIVPGKLHLSRECKHQL